MISYVLQVLSLLLQKSKFQYDLARIVITERETHGNDPTFTKYIENDPKYGNYTINKFEENHFTDTK